MYYSVIWKKMRKLQWLWVGPSVFILNAWPHVPSKSLNLLEDTGSKHSSEVEGSHAIVLVVALNEGKEVAEVAEEAVVDVWKLLEQVSHIWPRAIITTLYRHTTRRQNRSNVGMPVTAISHPEKLKLPANRLWQKS